MNLANGDDEIILIDRSGRAVHSVAYTGMAPWPNPTGRSMQRQDVASDNDSGGNWTVAPARGGSFMGAGTDRGTPSALAP